MTHQTSPSGPSQTPTVPQGGPAAPPRVDSAATWTEALRWGLHSAMSSPARTLLCVDPDFDHWPLSDDGVLRSLTAWLKLPQRQMWMLANGFGGMARLHPRFVGWRQHWSHAVGGRVVPEELVTQAPRALVVPGLLAVHLVQPNEWRGWASTRRQAVQPLWDNATAIWERSETGFASTPLGL